MYPLAFCRCILVDENDRVVGHESKYNCKYGLCAKVAFSCTDDDMYVVIVIINRIIQVKDERHASVYFGN